MKKLISKIGAGLTAAALVGSLLAPAAFATNTINISLNGEYSTNKVSLSGTSNTTLKQGNKTSLTNRLIGFSRSGGNSATSNTGTGTVAIGTGPATTTVAAGIGGSINTSTLVPCPCSTTNNVTISTNGEYSTNTATISNNSTTNATQANITNMTNTVAGAAGSGGNTANGNTGAGAVTIGTGAATTDVSLTVNGSSNSL